jgi:hypothetical protein
MAAGRRLTEDGHYNYIVEKISAADPAGFMPAGRMTGIVDRRWLDNPGGGKILKATTSCYPTEPFMDRAGKVAVDRLAGRPCPADTGAGAMVQDR